MTQHYDLIVIGGGAAGFYAAITCAEQSALYGATPRVLILEKSSRVLDKVRISGGGRCNVTHHCFEPRRMATNYPRGNKALIGPLHRFGVAETVAWFAEHGLELKTEADGRMFPTTDSSQSVIDVLRGTADAAGIKVRTRAAVRSLAALNTSETTTPRFEVTLKGGESLYAHFVVLATGGARAGAGSELARQLGHRLIEPVPSLFTFHVDDWRIRDLQGLAVDPVSVRIDDADLENEGPLLITHRGFSAPAILKLSAWGARKLHALDYTFTLSVDWLHGADPTATFAALRATAGTRHVHTRSPFDAIPKRLWQRLVAAARIDEEQTWATLQAGPRDALIAQLTNATFNVTGKSTHKDEFVTAGGVPTDDLDMRTMESRICEGAYITGELLDIDGVTGGFNFQNAWTTGHLAGTAIAHSLLEHAG
ncbi:aminoacetone oxidase family FAD-binding enzyme [Bradymonadaceae bacterium TMQ3]|uniref:Aminoacetone oxidase family FAD-binding enzyme n=1 Tax=Lujinxingia sediminis TaxID=2480984 RepID=A0ABY0CXF5_9DELT|nr:aminoacetone oxidase family FAD-binding enzyme [Lujinxingia sediminis]RDV39384.1 aminoacetone oxidase family FAD-binding enzyme [Bradymonadaceae bacterium TMQ3]RVU48578.1 aminoacetone oxidase family FAD-binding enzyme [Lujinxingia sediminis]TXC77872.1 aminoacetone oxidase family FAD-binding enzyme [Bradymonadales bacterium TMQ1]